jgi:DNA polymerase III delta subunit
MSAREPLKPVYSIWGEDRATVDRAAARLAARVQEEGGMPPERVRAEETAADDVVAACEALSFAGLRLILVEAADAWRAADAAPLVAYLAVPNPGTCLALVSSGQLTPKLHEAVAAAGAVLHYGPDPKDRGRKRTGWFVEHFVKEAGRAGGSVTQAVARKVVERVMVDPQRGRGEGVTALELTREAEKLAAYADGEPITAEMVDALVARHPDAKSYELADALTRGDGAATYEVLQDLATGDHPVAPILVQVQLANHFRRLAAVQAMGPDVAPAEAGRAAGVASPFAAQRLVEQARGLAPSVVQAAVARCAALELELRVSSLRNLGRSPDDGERLVLETAARDLLALTRGGRPAPAGSAAR